MKKAMQNLGKNFFVIVLIFLGISAVFTLFSPSSVDKKEISISQLGQEIMQEKVKELAVSGNDIHITYSDNTQAQARKEAELALSESLANYGVTKEKLEKVNVVVREPKAGWGQIGSILLFVVPLLFFGLFFWSFARQAKMGAMQTFNFSKARARIFGAEGHPKQKINFQDVAGLEEAKEELQEIVEFLKTPKKFLDMGAKIPRGVLLLGPPGCGKCVIGETKVITNKGFVKISDMPKYFTVDEKGAVQGCKIFTADFQCPAVSPKAPSHWFDLGIQRTTKISSQLGIEIEGTPEHPVAILNKESGDFQFKRLDQIRKGDVLIVNYNHQVFGNYRILPDSETAYILGLLTGDGGLSIKDRIYFSNEDAQLVNFVKTYFRTHFGVVLKRCSSREYDWLIANQKVKQTLKNYGVDESYANGKKVPDSIMMGPKKFQIDFIKGLFDTDGYVNAKYGVIQLSSASKELMEQTHALLLNLGVINRIHPKRKKYNNKLQYYIEISGDFLRIFAKEIGFGLKTKQNKLKKTLSKASNTNINLVPYQKKRLKVLWEYFKSENKNLNRAFYHGIKIKNIYRYIDGTRNPSKRSLGNLLVFLSSITPKIKRLPEYKYLYQLSANNFFFTPVIKITKNHKNRVYDFTVPKTHSFVANGIINHNTLLARATAGESNVPFFSVAGSEFIELFVGVGSGRVRSLFQDAKKHNKAIIFIDELDAIGRTRGIGIGGGHDEREQTLNQILVEMDGFERDAKTIVIAASNRPDILDPALLRPGRFDRQVILTLPSIEDREAILKIHARGKPLAKNANLREIAERTPGFSGADLENLLNEAAILAARRNKKQVDQSELTESIEKVLLGPERKSHILSPREKKISAYHEAGHALVASFTDKGEPVRKISIVSRGLAAGYTIKSPVEEKSIKGKSDFLSDIATLLGGYFAEKIKFKEVSTGASNDLKIASDLARKLVKDYGMSEKLGPIVFGERNELQFLGKEFGEDRNYSEKIAQKIDEEVAKVIKQAANQAIKILKAKNNLLEKLSKELIKKETLEREELEKILKIDRKKRQ